jgi:hypothetical protein
LEGFCEGNEYRVPYNQEAEGILFTFIIIPSFLKSLLLGGHSFFYVAPYLKYHSFLIILKICSVVANTV